MEFDNDPKYRQLNKRRIGKDLRRVKYPSRTKDHPTWHAEEKPWADEPIYPYKGLHTSIELHYLYRTVRDLGHGNYANLGVFRGASTHVMAHGAAHHDSMVYAVDLFDPKYYSAASIEDMNETFEERGQGHLVTFCKGWTKDWAETLKDTKFKFIFVDADHSYASCLEDFTLWSPLLEEGGQIAFHDVDMDTVNQVIEEDMDDWEMVEHAFRTKSFKRKGE